jgi:DNA-binding CsgD family transcriptional regulator
MAGTTARHVEDIVRRCYVGLDATALRVEMLHRLRSVVPVDAAFFATVDPTTMLFTSAVSEEPLIAAAALFLDNEIEATDVNRFADLAAARDPVSSLDSATQGDRRASPRYTEIMAPLQLGDELRIALKASGHCWGVMCLHRDDVPSGFTDHEAAILRRLGPHLAEGLRRANLLAGPALVADGPAGTGIVILDHELSVLSINPAAEFWLSEIAETDWPRSAELPVAVYAAVAQLERIENDGRPAPLEPGVRLRTAAGRWVAVHASRLTGPTGVQTAVVFESARPAQLVSIYLSAHGLTPAQTRVAGLVLQGRNTKQMVTELHLSSYTIQEHLSAVFDKFGVRSRRELVAALMTRY